nr:ring-cleaving dioxygenase [Rhodococcus sp. (in: high G+C Gram-positive bacteria)]
MSTIKPVGLHHVTAIATDPARNVEFYTRVLGLRLVKQTVNFDDPGSYHLYYGDEQGAPSTLLTFFPWPDVPVGRSGPGLATVTAFAVPGNSLGFWDSRLTELGIGHERPRTVGDEEVLRLRDHDGIVIDLVATDGDARSGWDGVGGISTEHAVRGLHSITLSETDLDATAEMLTDLMSMSTAEETTESARFVMTPGEVASVVNLVTDSQDRGVQAGGTVHHVAFRAPDETTLSQWHDQLRDAGKHVTEILDRQYFKSIYFREPGGVLFEIATDTPGFDVDEPLLELGRHLKLPPWLEPNRTQIEANLPPLK